MALRGSFAVVWAAAACTLHLARGLVVRQTNSSLGEKSLGNHEAEKTRNGNLHSCLAAKRIVFVGPSTSKFDYLTLAYFTEYGVWPTEDKVAIGPSGAQIGPNPLYEWNIRNELKAGGHLPPEVTAVNNAAGCIAGGGTETFMRYTNHILNNHEVCDCHQNGDWKGVGDWYNSTENRVYLNGNTMLAYFQWFGDTVSPRGTIDITPALALQPKNVLPTCPVGQFPGKWAWQATLPVFLQHIVKYAAPTHLIVSGAFWPTPLTTAPFWDQVADAGAAAVANTGEVYWRTTPQRTDHAPTDPSSNVDTARFLKRGWKIFPAADIVSKFQGARHSKEIFYDFTHIKPAPASFLMQTWLQSDVCPVAAVAPVAAVVPPVVPAVR